MGFFKRVVFFFFQEGSAFIKRVVLFSEGSTFFKRVILFSEVVLFQEGCCFLQ